MAFEVHIVNAAWRDIDDAIAFIFADSPAIAQKWFDGLTVAIQSLSDMPLRFAFIAEAKDLKRPLRSFAYHSHRVIYEVDEDERTVSVLRVYHSARIPIQVEDVS